MRNMLDCKDSTLPRAPREGGRARGAERARKYPAFVAALSLAILALVFMIVAPNRADADERHRNHILLPFIVQPSSESGPAPDFRLRDLDDIERSLSEFKGKTVLLHFWASWCEPCREEFPALSKLASDFRDRGLVVLGVAIDSKKRVMEFLEKSPAGFPMLIDQYGEAKKSYRVGVIPMSVIIGKSGKIEGVLAGPRDYGSPAAAEFLEKNLR
ncbi:MAG: TlpA family protein disulfide reductase [Candidatus Methylomirabilis sp.]|nr:TlpA family protein disulfide reductase [Deltaproteobacteria bacterium]